MKKSHFSVLAGSVLYCAVLLNACELQPSVADPVAETPIEQPDGMPPEVGLETGTPQLVGSHFEVPVTVKGTLDTTESPKFTAASGLLTDPTPAPAYSIGAMIQSHPDLFEWDESSGSYKFKAANYGTGTGKEVFSIVVITKAEIAKLKTFLLGKMAANASLFIFEENPALTSVYDYTNGWKKIGANANENDWPNMYVTGVTASNFDDKIKTLSVVVVAGTKVRVSFFNEEPFVPADATAGTSDFIITTRDEVTPLEPVFVYEIDGSALTAVTP